MTAPGGNTPKQNDHGYAYGIPQERRDPQNEIFLSNGVALSQRLHFVAAPTKTNKRCIRAFELWLS